jgi:DNA-binding transcriptional MerR regulator
MDTQSLLTIGEIARRADCPVHRVAYFLRARRIAPAFRAGGTRVFTEQQVAGLIHELSPATRSDVKMHS